MSAIKVNLPSGQELIFRVGENSVRSISEDEDDFTVHTVPYVLVDFDPQEDGDEEWGEPCLKISKRLVTNI